MIAFAVPLLIGNLFQQLYNTADALIVGRMLGNVALAAVSAPLIVMDTTPTFDFITEAGAQAIDRNHGIHGVQDLCSMLRRRGIPYHLACGPLEDGSVTRQVAGLCRAAQAAETMRHIKVGLIGGAFDGMGDFRLDAQTLTDVTGAEVVCPDPAELRAHSL